VCGFAYFMGLHGRFVSIGLLYAGGVRRKGAAFPTSPSSLLNHQQTRGCAMRRDLICWAAPGVVEEKGWLGGMIRASQGKDQVVVC